MNVKPSWDTTGDLLEAVDPKPKNVIFKHVHSYTQKLVESYSIQDFDLNVLVQNQQKGKIRTVSDETIYNDSDISGYLAIPLYNVENKEITGYQLLNSKKKSQPIKVGTGIPVSNISNLNTPCFIATDNLNLFIRLSQLNYVSVFHHKINTAFEAVNNYFDEAKPRIIATDKKLNDVELTANSGHGRQLPQIEGMPKTGHPYSKLSRHSTCLLGIRIFTNTHRLWKFIIGKFCE
ncbi:hypothetical protein [Acinetobacter sp. MD2(2019)]|uniref:hypothetical protein n=1 Tax=Acinetobacter sp. MD2(2019) TaxID=2605273 RepID=UPI002D1F800B|nr:hypothetical protein [Acinetobacter sp. MD2(2019)]MEB3754304.1 hypothetical protein [Acinetobacter sp. MD2(2019)]